MACPSCAAPLPPGAKFCPECGTRIAQPGAPTPASKMPPSRSPTRHERRLLTVLFGDLVGFTASSDHADPEDVRARVRPFHTLVRAAVAATGGTVARVVGDGVMAVWGYPVAREDDARRAIDAALRILEGLPGAGEDLHARIGVNTGEAVVAFGSDDEDADDAMGDAVNVAARLSTAAQPDHLLVGSVTRALAADAFEYDDLEPVRVKGKADPIAVARVVGRARTRRDEARAAFVGREADVDRVVDVMTASERDRALQRALIVGEPGIGKSRLIAEVRSRAKSPGRTWHTGRCRSDVSVPGLALGEVIKTWARISDDDPPALAAERLDAAVPPGVPDRAWLVDRLRPLVGLAAAGSAARGETFVAWARALELLVGDRGAVIVLEDVHWADDDLVQFIGSDALAAVAAPIAVLLTGRPEALEQEVIATAVDEMISLRPLDGDALDGLLSAEAPDLGLSPGDRAEIIRRGGGNPLFTLELVRLRSQRKAAGHDDLDALPDTVQAVIAARLDLLPGESRSVAQDAAVVGAAFWPGALERIEARGAGLDASLAELIRLDLIRRRNASTLAGEPEFAFRHALVRDVAYGQLTRTDRATRHAAVARWLVEVAPDRLDLAGVIGDHDVRALELIAAASVEPPAGLQAHAYEHLMRAGRHAEAFDPAAAAERYRQAASFASDARGRLAALIGVVRSLEEQGAYAAELETIATARELASSLDDRLALGRLLIHESDALRPLSDPRWATCVKAALDLLEQLPPSPELMEALAQQALVELALLEGTTAGVERYATQAIELSERLGIDPPAMAYSRRGFARAGQGDPHAIEDVLQARHFAEAGSPRTVVARIISDQGGVGIYFGQIHEAENLLREAIGIARRTGLGGIQTHLETNLVYVLRAVGRWDEAVALAEPALVPPIPEERRFTLEVRATELLFIRADRGDLPGVEALVELLPPRGNVQPGAQELMRAMARVLLGALRLDAGLIVDGHTALDTRDDDLDFDGRWATEYPALVRAALWVNRPDLVDRFIRSIAAQAPLAQTTRTLLVGYRASGMGEHDEAIAALTASGDQLAAWGFLPEATHARQQLVVSQLAAGREHEALARVEEIRSVWRQLGAALPLRRLEQLLDAHRAGARQPS